MRQSKKISEEYKKAKSLLKSYLDSSKDMIILSIDCDYRYLYFNKKHSETMHEMYGCEPIIGQNILDCITVEKDKKMQRIIMI